MGDISYYMYISSIYPYYSCGFFTKHHALCQAVSGGSHASGDSGELALHDARDEGQEDEKSMAENGRSIN